MKAGIERQLHREIADTEVTELFICYNPQSHVLERHCGITHRELKERLAKVTYKKDGIMAMSRFYRDGSYAVRLIHKCLESEYSGILTWLKQGSGNTLELVKPFNTPVGDGIVKGTDWNVLYPMSNIAVMLAPSDIKGRLFKVVTAYPIPNLDECDLIWDEIDNWQQAKKVNHF